MLTYDQADTRTLIARAQAGDQQAFAQLYRTHWRYVCAVVHRYLGADVDSVPDLAQEAFTHAWRGLPGYRLDGPAFQAWLATIARNVVVDHHRHRAARADTRAVGTAADMPETSHDPHQQVDDRVQVVVALRQLSGPHRRVLALHYLGGWSGPEIAAELCCPEGTVKSRLRHGRLAASRLAGVADG